MRHDKNYTQLKGAYHGCSWCGGRGCNQCDIEAEKAFKRMQEPMISVTHEELEDPEMLAAFRDAVGMEALQKAFGPDGGGMQEVALNSVLFNLKQLTRKALPPEPAGE